MGRKESNQTNNQNNSLTKQVSDKEEGKDQESIQSSTTLDPGYRMGT